MVLDTLIYTGYYIPIILLAFSNFALAQNGAYTIFNTPNYTQQQTCLQNCFMNYGDNGSKLPGYLGCAWDGSKFLDACVCRADLAQLASAFLTKCVSSACSLYPADVPSAISLYNSYCSTPGGNIATTTLGGASTAPTVVVITTVFSAGNSVIQSGSESRSVALVGGLVALIFSLEIISRI
jgi:hypothetical protein